MVDANTVVRYEKLNAKDSKPGLKTSRSNLRFLELGRCSPMPQLLALDVAIVPPLDVCQRAVQLNAELRVDPAHDLTLDESHLPHVTLTQQLIHADAVEAAFERLDAVLRAQRPITVRVTGGARTGNSIWMAIDKAQPLTDLHSRLMEALHGFEQPRGGPAAFFDGDARVEDITWVTCYRRKASFGAFTPHITLGHADRSPRIDPFEFEATTVAACHLGRFCSCRRLLRAWELM